MHPQARLYIREAANHAELQGRYPKQFDCEHNGRGWPDGWHRLVEHVVKAVAERGVDVRWVQIKEKFGSLRMYRRGGTPRVDLIGERVIAGLVQSDADLVAEAVTNAERQSRTTCMRCGGNAQQYIVERLIVTLCEQDFATYCEDWKGDRGRAPKACRA